MTPATDTHVCGVRVAACDYSFILSETEKAITKKQMLLVSPIASQTIAKASQQSDLKSILSKFTYLVPDGYWVKKALEWKYGFHLKNRIYGPTLMKTLLSMAANKKYKIAFYGTNSDTLNSLGANVRRHNPGIRIVASIPSLYRPLTKREYDSLVSRLNKASPDLLFIGLGSPLQEEFAVRLTENRQPRLKPLTVFTVGAAFDFIAGTKKQAPDWLGDKGFEWLFRLIQEPGRLWRRYAIYGTAYLFHLLGDILRSKMKQV